MAFLSVNTLMLPLPTFTPRPSLGPWLVLVVVLNILLCTTGGFAGDIYAWVDWTRQLQNNGYTNLTANYPPVFVHWLWLIGKASHALHIGVTGDPLLRFLANTPILLAHCGLLALIYRLTQTRHTPLQQKLCLLFVSANPALLLDGPLWGQVDLLFAYFVALGLYYFINNQKLVYVLPLLTLALLSKFQTICVAPLLLPLFWHCRAEKKLWLGLIPAALITALLLLPYWMAGSARQMIDLTYLKASSLFPYATYNADNLWYLLGLNTTPDNAFLFNRAQTASGWRYLFSAKPLGILLMSLWGIGISISSWRHDNEATHWRNAWLSSFGFFLLLPGMHERYLIPAVVFALMAYAANPRAKPYAWIITLIAALNMLWIYHPTGGLLGYSLAALTCLFALWMISPHPLRAWLVSYAQRCKRLPIATYWLACAALWSVALGIHLWRVWPQDTGVVDANTINILQAHQGWGALQLNKSVTERPLNVHGQHWQLGFGTHADSRIVLSVPPGALTFSTEFGLDDAAVGGSVQFKIQLDDQSAWESTPFNGGDPAGKVQLTVSGKQRLTLIVNGLGNIDKDHANWLNPRFNQAR